jgi:hypothetical protein
MRPSSRDTTDRVQEASRLIRPGGTPAHTQELLTSYSKRGSQGWEDWVGSDARHRIARADNAWRNDQR